jgi:glycerol uptake facilitator-like aquaporin
MTIRWLLHHVAVEFIGSLSLLFIGCMQTAWSGTSPYTQAAAFSAIFTTFRSMWAGVELDPLACIPELLIYPYLASNIGRAKIFLSIIAQFGGAICGTLLARFFYGAEGMNAALTLPQNDMMTGYHIVISEALFCLLMAFSNQIFHHQTYTKWRRKLEADETKPAIVNEFLINVNNNHPVPSAGNAVSALVNRRLNTDNNNNNNDDNNNNNDSPNSDWKSNLQEPIAVGTLYFIAIGTMAPLTSGSFILTRTFGPAIVQGYYEYSFFYVLGQFIGHFLATFGVYIVYYEH